MNKILSFLVVCVCTLNVAFAQNRVTGKVTDASGEPLPGVSVLVKGTANGTITDLDGNYSLSVPTGSTLSVSCIGFVTQDIPVGNRSVINVTLEEDALRLEETVVIGYGVQKKVNLTGSVASVSSEDLQSKPVMNTSIAIAGLVPGLSVIQNSGRPGTGASVKIRGTGTFSSAGTNPLVLINGFSGSMDDVDPNDIESISFLKDAASASIYGNRAANGVILIETKKGAAGKTTFTYTNSFGWQRPTEYPDFLESAEYAEYYNMAMANMGRPDAYSADEIQKFRNGTDPDNYPNVNHLKWLLSTGSGFQQQHNIGVRGGNGSTTYNVSAGYRNQEGMTANTNNERLTLLMSLRSNLTDKLILDLNANAYNNRYNAPNGEPTSIDGMIGYSVREGPIFAGRKSDGTFGYQDNYSPEAWMNSESFVQNISRHISASAQLKWLTPIEGLSLTGKAGTNYSTSYNKTFRAVTFFDNSKTIGPASLSVSSSNNVYTSLEALANYDRTFGDHTVNLLAGMSVEQTINRSINGSRNTFPNNYLWELSSGDSSTASNGSSLNENALVSFFGRANYSYKGKYLLEANIRYDGSSRFATARRWGLFPSVSAGWRISEEDFWKNGGISNVINSLKFRASIGVLGNQNIGNYPYQQNYTIGRNYPLGNPAAINSGAYIGTYNNQNISWERTRVTDFGIDFTAFGGAFSGTVDYFYKYTSDILSSVEVAAIMGRSVGQSNVGAVSNRGVEINLTYKGNIGRDFLFTIAPNFTYIRNAVEELADGALEDINNGRIVGQPLGIIYGYRTNGLFVDQAEIDAAPNQLVRKSGLKPGYVYYMDLSGPDGKPDGTVNAQYDRVVLGSTTPKFYYGLNLNASFKGFDFSALLQGVGGHKRRIGSYMAYAFYNGGQIQRWQADNCWTTSNPDKWAEYPRIETMNMNNANAQVSDYWVRDATFLRIKNVQFGYTFPRSLTSKVRIDNLRVYVSGQNLYSFNSFYKGWDPENEIGTGDSPSYYPINSIFSFGVNIKF